MKKILKIIVCLLLVPVYPLAVYGCSIFGILIVMGFIVAILHGVSYLFDRKQEDKEEFIDALYMLYMPFYMPIDWAIDWINDKTTFTGNL